MSDIFIEDWQEEDTPEVPLGSQWGDTGVDPSEWASEEDRLSRVPSMGASNPQRPVLGKAVLTEKRLSYLSDFLADALKYGKSTALSQGLYPKLEDSEMWDVPAEDVIPHASQFIQEKSGYDYDTLIAILEDAGGQDGIDWAWHLLGAPKRQWDEIDRVGAWINPWTSMVVNVGGAAWDLMGDPVLRAMQGDPDLGLGQHFKNAYDQLHSDEMLLGYDPNPYSGNAWSNRTGIHGWEDALWAGFDLIDLISLGFGGRIIAPARAGLRHLMGDAAQRQGYDDVASQVRGMPLGEQFAERKMARLELEERERLRLLFNSSQIEERAVIEADFRAAFPDVVDPDPADMMGWYEMGGTSKQGPSGTPEARPVGSLDELEQGAVEAWEGGPLLFHGTAHNRLPRRLKESITGERLTGLYTTPTAGLADTYAGKEGFIHNLVWGLDRPPRVLDISNDRVSAELKQAIIDAGPRSGDAWRFEAEGSWAGYVESILRGRDLTVREVLYESYMGDPTRRALPDAYDVVVEAAANEHIFLDPANVRIHTTGSRSVPTEGPSGTPEGLAISDEPVSIYDEEYLRGEIGDQTYSDFLDLEDTGDIGEMFRREIPDFTPPGQPRMGYRDILAMDKDVLLARHLGDGDNATTEWYVATLEAELVDLQGTLESGLVKGRAQIEHRINEIYAEFETGGFWKNVHGTLAGGRPLGPGGRSGGYGERLDFTTDEIDEIVRNQGGLTDDEIRRLLDEGGMAGGGFSPSGFQNLGRVLREGAREQGWPGFEAPFGHHPVRKIISGGQTGGDISGVRAGKELGLETGGWMPEGWLTEGMTRGSRIGMPEYEELYGMREAPRGRTSIGMDWRGEPWMYRVYRKDHPWGPRTFANAADGDGTLWIGQTGSPGYKLTREGVVEGPAGGHMFVASPQEWEGGLRNPELRANFLAWLNEHNIQTLNVAGPRKSTYHKKVDSQGRDFEAAAKAFLVETLGEPPPAAASSAMWLNPPRPDRPVGRGEITTQAEYEAAVARGDMEDVDTTLRQAEEEAGEREAGSFTDEAIDPRERGLPSQMEQRQVAAGLSETNVHYTGGDNPILSNFSDTPIEFRGHTFATPEGAYQAYKRGRGALPIGGFQDLSGVEAKKLGGRIKLDDEAKSKTEDLMREILRAKADQYPDFVQALRDTGDSRITHNVPGRPDHWNTQGSDAFSKLLTELREELAAGPRRSETRVHFLPDANVEYHAASLDDINVTDLDQHIAGLDPSPTDPLFKSYHRHHPEVEPTQGWQESHLARDMNPENRHKKPMTRVMGEPGTEYYYTNKNFVAQEWSPMVLRIKERMEALTGYTFDLALIQRYPSGHTDLGFHSDLAQTGSHARGNQPEQVVVSVNFGATREFAFAPSQGRGVTQAQAPDNILGSVELGNGDVLIMMEGTNANYQHSIVLDPDLGVEDGLRINITFRQLDPSLQSTPRRPPGSALPIEGSEIVKTLPMAFDYGKGGALPAADNITSENTFDAILAGERTATTRSTRTGQLQNVEVGDIIQFTRRNRDPITVRVTAKRFAGQITPEQWARLEGYDADAARQNWASGKRYSQDIQIEFELVDAPIAAPRTGLPTAGVPTPPPTFRLERQWKITPKDVRDNPDKIYLFGDNWEETGFAGQAVIRGAGDNVLGIPTKKYPGNKPEHYLTDLELDENIARMEEAFSLIPEGSVVVMPERGLGTGFAQLKKKAPMTYEWLIQRLRDLEG